MPTSAGFFLKPYDPRKHDYAYATFKRLPDGRGIVFGGFGAVTTGDNAVTAYNPVTDTWETLLATQTFTICPQLGDGTYDVRGKSFLGNRDNQFGLVHPMMMPVIARRQPARGASHGRFWAPGAYVSPGVFADQLILNGQGNGTTYGLRLNY